MTVVSLTCDVCDRVIVADPHWPHETECDLDGSCQCAAITCWSCCWTCEEEASA